MTSRLKVACLGAGYFSQFHLESWRRIVDVACVGVCDASLSKAEATGATAFTSLSHMLDSVHPDILDIITPPPSHFDAIRTAIESGVKCIICQKPFCVSLDEAEDITKRCAEAGVELVIHENFRFQPWYRALNDALKQSEIGQVHQAHFRFRPGDGQGPKAYLERQPYFQNMERFLVHETAVHWIDTFRFLFGDPIAVYADLRQRNPAIKGEDAGLIVFDHPYGIQSVFDGNRHLDHLASDLRKTMGEAWVEGANGTIVLTGDGDLLLRKFQKNCTDRLFQASSSPNFGGDCVHRLQNHLVSGLLHGTILENKAQDYLRVLRIEQAIYASAKKGQKIALEDF